MTAPPTKARAEPIKFNKAYFQSIPFILKVLQLALSIPIVVLAQQYWGNEMIIYISFAGVFGACTTVMWILMFASNVNARFPAFFPVLMVLFHLLMSLVFLAAAICSAMMIEVLAFLVAMILAFIVSVLFIADTVFSFLWWRGGEELPSWPCC